MASGAKSDDGSTQIQSIGELIRAGRLRSGFSYRDLSARAEAAGFSVKFQYLKDLANSGPKSWPKNTDTFRALSAALHLPVKRIILAYAISLGLNVTDSGSELASRLPENLDLISPKMTDAILAIIRAASAEAQASSVDPDKLGLAADSSKNHGKVMKRKFESPGEGSQEQHKH
ncbi:hypothetical protein [Renibacterium salmoninarum]|uniref:hypothetical protein n=1 Tax=Renibacterium salmoninarum TaxID=1646 RepID=UPI000DF80AE1|nr:hypothetical protein [Renibacterium salmoninarum]